MTQVVLCDADGVTIVPPGYGSSYALETCGCDPKILIPFFAEVFPFCKSGVKDLKEEITPYLKQVGYPKSADVFLDTWFRYEHVIDEACLKEIQALRTQGIYCALATDQEIYRKQYILDQMKFDSYFDTMYISSDIGHSKTTNAYYDVVFHDLYKRFPGIEKNQIVLIDDTQDVVDTAKQFGIQAELYTGIHSICGMKIDLNISV